MRWFSAFLKANLQVHVFNNNLIYTVASLISNLEQLGRWRSGNKNKYKMTAIKQMNKILVIKR